MRKLFQLSLYSALMASSAFSADNYTWGNVNFEGGGFVDGIITSKTQKDLVYARTDVGGAYRWDVSSGKWIPLMDWVSEQYVDLYGVEAIALDPNNSAIVYIMAGMTYNQNARAMILRSSDYGATFDTVSVSSQFKIHGNGMGRQAGEKLLVDPLDGKILYCGTRINGLFRSPDSGKTWSAIATTTFPAEGSITESPGITYIIPDPTSGKAANGGTKVLYVGVAKAAGSSLYKSTDGGVTFTAVAGAPAQMAMRAVLVNGFLYGTYCLGPGPHSQSGGSVWKYNTGTGAWTNISPLEPGQTYAYASGKENYQYGFGGISVDPNNASRLVLSTEASYEGANNWLDGKGNAGDVFFTSTDGGSTWNVLNPKGSTNKTLNPNGNNWVSGSSIHWAGSIEFDPFDTKRVWVGSGNGVFRTDDIDAAPAIWSFQSRGIEETVPLDMVSVPGGPLVTAIYDYNGATYDDILVSTPAHTNPVGTVKSLGYGALVGGFIRSGRVTDYSVSPSVTYDVMYISKDNGRTWKATDTSSIVGSSGTHAMSADGKVYLIRPTNLKNGKGANSSTFYRSADDGKSWTAVTGISSDKGSMVSDPVDPSKFYIMPDGYIGDLLGSTDGGATFTKLSTLKNPNTNNSPKSSSMLRAAPGVAGDLWLCLDAEEPWSTSGYSANGLAHSTDAGKTWTYINTMDGCLSIGLGKAAPGASYFTLYMWGAANGDKRGIYRSIDKGATWVRINDSQHQFGGPANGQFVLGDFNVYGRVYMSTTGRGLIYGNIGTLISPIKSTRIPQNIAFDLKQQGRNVYVQSQGLHNARLEIYSLTGSLLQRNALYDNTQSVSLSALSKGPCIARLVASEGIMVSKRLILQ